MTDYRALVDAALADPERAPIDLAVVPAHDLEEALRALVRERGEAALPLVTALGERGSGPVRRVAKRVLYRLAQSGVALPARGTRPVVERRPERAIRAWISGIDGSGSRAAWVLFEGGYGGLSLCSVIINDVAGILEAAGGEITKKRLAAELATLRASQKLPWVELPPEPVIARVADALALHRSLATSPPASFGRWERRFASATPPDVPAADTAGPSAAGAVASPGGPAPDPALVERSAELFELPELMGWFLDPERVQADAVRLLEARSSVLVVSDQTKAERERAIMEQVLDRELTEEARHRWALRLVEMAQIFDLTDRPRAASAARETARALVDPGQSPARIPFARGLAQRALEVAAEVTSGRVRAADVSRQPRERSR